MTNTTGTHRILFLRTFFGLAALFLFTGLLHAQQVTADKERLTKTVRFLSDPNFQHDATPKTNEETINLIVDAMTAAGFEAARGEFALTQILGDSDFSIPPNERSKESVEITFQRLTYTNIHALKKGKTNKRIIVGAHYDNVAQSPGADDNASGVAVLLELAHLLKTSAELNRDVELVAYDMEEVGLWGSRFHARKLKNQNIDVVCMLCLDMVGYFSDEEDSQRYPVRSMNRLYGTKGDFLAMVGRPADATLMTEAQKAFQKGTTLKLQSFAAPNLLEPLFARSDHAPFWWEGYPALFFTDTADYRTTHYHQATDTWDTLDYDRMAQVAVGLYHVVLAIDAAQ